MALPEFQRRLAHLYELPPSAPDPFGRSPVTPKMIKDTREGKILNFEPEYTPSRKPYKYTPRRRR